MTRVNRLTRCSIRPDFGRPRVRLPWSPPSISKVIPGGDAVRLDRMLVRRRDRRFSSRKKGSMALLSVPYLYRIVALITLIALSILAGSIRSAGAEARNFTLTVISRQVPIASGLMYNATTFDGTVPGPLLRAHQGDHVSISLVNHTSDAHGINVQAAQIAPAKFSGDPVKPVNYTFSAQVPGWRG